MSEPNIAPGIHERNPTPDTPAHTPLPWKYQAGFQNVYALSGGDVGLTIHIAKTNEEQVAGGYAEAEANAAFIVRACNSHYQLVEALKAAIDAIEDDRGLDDYICCSGYMCGCQGSSKRQLMLHDLRTALSQAGGASE